ncbi:hypothetical protein V1512DRAFT_261802 [Lipomyces arxii]|uniref:uncharacterized protein n=1 Tax=Lipomyces arxii TaxID=56418 RepID=UPI0034CF6427
MRIMGHDPQRSMPMDLVKLDKAQYPVFFTGAVIGFLTATVLPCFTSLIRSVLIQIGHVVLILVLWTVLIAAVFVGFKAYTAGDIGVVRSTIQTGLDKLNTIITRAGSAADVSSNEYAARPYPDRPSSPVSSCRSLSPTTTMGSRRKVPEKISRKHSSSVEVAFKPYDEHPAMLKDKARSKTTNSLLARSPNIMTPPTRDPNRIALVAAYVRTDMASDVWTPIKSKFLSLRITAAGLLLDDESGMKGGDLTVNMIASIEHDVSKHSVMRVTTGSQPPIQVTYIIQDDERWKVALGVHALRRELGKDLRLKEVEGTKLLNFSR